MERVLFDENWIFGKGSGSALSNLFGGKTTEHPVTLPHDAALEFDRDPLNYMGSGNAYIREENCYYYKNFFVEKKDCGKGFILEFDGVYHNAYVYVNQSFAGKHGYGYGKFLIEITKFLKYGEENQIRVIVKSGSSSGRWYTGSGIYRHVYLLKSDILQICPDSVKISTLDTDSELAVISVEADLSNRGLVNQKTRLNISLFDKEGNEAGNTSLPAFLAAGDHRHVITRLYVKNPKLWDAENPNLYNYSIRLLNQNGAVSDTENGHLGIRKLQLDPVRGLRVNGKSVLLRGGCLHHDNGILGACEYEETAMEKIRKLKDSGYNAVRSSHYPISRELLDACDFLGMYIMDEYTDVWTTSKVDFDYSNRVIDDWEYDVEQMVAKDFNHPSVIMYSIGNEIPETGNDFDLQFGRKIAEKIRSLDANRYVTNAINLTLAVMDRLPEVMGDLVRPGEEINTLMNNLGESMSRITGSDYAANATEEACSYLDIIGFNYAAVRYEIDREKFPNRILIGSETYSADLDRNWELVERIPQVLGDFNWTCFDYLGESGIGQITYGENQAAFYGPYPWRAAYCGDFDLIGRRRPVSYWRERIWKKNLPPYIAVQPPYHFGEKKNLSQWAFSDAIRSWNFTGMEEKPVLVEVYSDSEEIELLLNGESVGRKTVGETKKNMVIFETFYRPGKIEAIAYKDGQRVSTDVLETASEEVAVHTEIRGEKLLTVDISLVDAKGIVNPEQNRKLKVLCQGPGEFLGAGSANPVSEENFTDSCFTTFEGCGRAYIRRIGDGEIQVNVRIVE